MLMRSLELQSSASASRDADRNSELEHSFFHYPLISSIATPRLRNRQVAGAIGFVMFSS